MTKDSMHEERSSAGWPDPAMSRFRERVAALIAVLVIFAAIAMLVIAFLYIGDSEKFARAKDLLLIINPVLGVVIGYYFNKVSTEARAESAESTARSATVDARRAAESRDEAEELARAARAEAQESRSRLDDLSRAAEKVLAQPPARGAASLAPSGTGKPIEDAWRELEAALARAKQSRGG
jgi:hypothetical protein